jgi:hypothetical protein
VNVALDWKITLLIFFCYLPKKDLLNVPLKWRNTWNIGWEKVSLCHPNDYGLSILHSSCQFRRQWSFCPRSSIRYYLPYHFIWHTELLKLSGHHVLYLHQHLLCNKIFTLFHRTFSEK